MSLMKKNLYFPQDILYFLYLVIFKPYTLDKWISAIAPVITEKRNLNAIWRSQSEYPGLRSVFLLSLFHTYITPLLLVSVSAISASYIVQPESLIEEQLLSSYLGSSLFITIFLLVVMTLLSWSTVKLLAANVLIGLIIGITICINIFYPFTYTPTNDLGYIISSGLFFGIILEIGWDYAIINEPRTDLFTIGCFSILLVIFAFALTATNVLALAWIVFVLIAFFRVPVYILQAIWESCLFFRQVPLKGAEWAWKLSPAVWDEVVLLPIPYLDLHLLRFARENRVAGLKAIDYVATLTRQKWATRNAILNVISDDLRSSTSLLTIAAASMLLDTAIENNPARDKFFLLRLKEICELANAALESDSVFNHQEKSRLALEAVKNFRAGLSMSSHALYKQWDVGLEVLEGVFSSELKNLQNQYIVQNPYVAGAPLLENSIVFKGRRDIFRALENELNNTAGEYPTLMLFGGRRMGKTSIIRQLPIRLGPQIIPVDIDLQGASTVENVAGLMYLIAKQISESAVKHRRVTIPELTLENLETRPYIVFQKWISVVEKQIRNYKILLAFDEYESLEFMLDQKRVDERFFQLLRNLIQHHKKFICIFSGTHTLGELSPVWSNYLINVEVLKIGPLLQDDAVELITRPIPQFPLQYDDESVNLLIKETGCHPRWLQTACREIVNIANTENRLHITMEEVQRAIKVVPLRAEADFNDLWKGRDSNDVQRAILIEIAETPEGKCSSSELLSRLNKLFLEKDIFSESEFLVSHNILAEENRYYFYNASLLRRWVQEKNKLIRT